MREHEDLLTQAASGSSLTGTEHELLREVLRDAPEVAHPQSGHGLDDIALVGAGAASVIGVDYSEVAVRAAQRRADQLGTACRYVVGLVPGTPLSSACADLVYTGKGALCWMPDIAAWAREMARLLRPSGHLFVYEAHPAAALWTWDEDRPRIREDRGYFDRGYVNDSFPAGGAVEWQCTLGQIVTAVVEAGLRMVYLGEYPDPFWKYGGVTAAAWDGALPNSFALLARKDRAAAGHAGGLRREGRPGRRATK